MLRFAFWNGIEIFRGVLGLLQEAVDAHSIFFPLLALFLQLASQEILFPLHITKSSEKVLNLAVQVSRLI